MDLRKKSIIATDTPEKDEITARKEKKLQKTSKPKIKKVKRRIVEDEGSKRAVFEGDKAKKGVLDDESSDECEEWKSDSSDDNLNCSNDSEDEKGITDVGDFIIAKVFGKNSMRQYVAQIIKKLNDGYEVKFFSRHASSYRFIESKEEPAFLSFDEVVLRLPPPLKDKRARFLDMLYFNYDLTIYTVQ